MAREKNWIFALVKFSLARLCSLAKNEINKSTTPGGERIIYYEYFYTFACTFLTKTMLFFHLVLDSLIVYLYTQASNDVSVTSEGGLILHGAQSFQRLDFCSLNIIYESN